MTNHFRRLPLSGFIVCAVLLTGCDGQENQQQHPQAPQVSVHIVKSAPLAVTTELPAEQMLSALRRFVLRLAALSCVATSRRQRCKSG
jgi:hypothetical protein